MKLRSNWGPRGSQYISAVDRIHSLFFFVFFEYSRPLQDAAGSSFKIRNSHRRASCEGVIISCKRRHSLCRCEIPSPFKTIIAFERSILISVTSKGMWGGLGFELRTRRAEAFRRFIKLEVCHLNI